MSNKRSKCWHILWISSQSYQREAETNIEFDVLKKITVILAVAVDRGFEPGWHVYNRFNASNFSSGVYYCVMRAGKFVDVKKTMLMK
ncbi:MAG: hypothetical protein NZ923_00040 [Candidatus Kryptonium sp.]|nr:hypothetical protein [Candidatus Kryptonium sp.]